MAAEIASCPPLRTSSRGPSRELVACGVLNARLDLAGQLVLNHLQPLLLVVAEGSQRVHRLHALRPEGHLRGEVRQLCDRGADVGALLDALLPGEAREHGLAEARSRVR